MLNFKSFFTRKISEELSMSKNMNSASQEIDAYVRFSYKESYERMNISGSLVSFIDEYELLYELIFENLKQKKDNFDDYPYEEDENAMDRSLALSELIIHIDKKLKKPSF
jgi:hypothetical protein